LIDPDDLEPGEEERLQRAHDLLLQAGPPPELPPALLGAPRGNDAQIVQFPMLPRRRMAATFLAAAGVAAAAFGGGFLVGNAKSKPAAFATQKVVLMHAVERPASSRLAGQIKVAARDSVGNWPLEVAVSGLPQQSARGYYELWLTKKGKPFVPCGAFRVHGSTTTVRFTVPYKLTRYDGWVLTSVTRGSHDPGKVVLTT
jgi:Anti-sigma-K factor rskA